jgi:hypothetical protein
MKKLTLASLPILAVVVLIAAGCGGDTATSSKAADLKPSKPVCPAAWRPGWQRLADRIHAPVYCPDWMPNPLDGNIKGQSLAGLWVAGDRSYLVSFLTMDPIGNENLEVHVNFRGYPGHTAIPTCEDTVVVKSRTLHPKIPCFADPAGTKRIGPIKATVYTVNQGADTWHVLYAWRAGGSLYAVSEHVIQPYSYQQVLTNLDRIVRGLTLIRPAQ